MSAFCALWLVQAAPLPATQPELIDRVLAVVSGHVIMLSDVRAFDLLGLAEAPVAGTAVKSTLDTLIERRLMLDEVDRYILEEPAAAEIDRQIVRLRERFRDVPAYEAALATAGLTDGDLRQVVRDNERIRRYLDQRFGSAGVPSEQEVEAYYREHASELARDGVQPPLEAFREIIRQRLAEERRARLIDDWVAGLERRADIFRADGPS